MIKHPWQEVAKVEKFLGLPNLQGKREQFVFNETKHFYCLKETGCLAKSKGRAHPYVSKKLEAMLRKFYAPFNQALYRLIGHDFGWSDKVVEELEQS